jgi:hypothetical protein
MTIIMSRSWRGPIWMCCCSASITIDLIVVFLCEDYLAKEWSGLEWRAIRDIIKHSRDATVMLLRLDQAQVPGLFGIDGYIDVSTWTPTKIAEAIVKRLRPNDASARQIG